MLPKFNSYTHSPPSPFEKHRWTPFRRSPDGSIHGLSGVFSRAIRKRVCASTGSKGVRQM